MSDVTDGSEGAASAACDGAERFRQQAELRRLQREVDLAGHTTAALADRLRRAEAELADASSPVVAAMAVELVRWQARAGASEAELARLRSNLLFRLVAPLWAVARVSRRAPELLGRLAHRLS